MHIQMGIPDAVRDRLNAELGRVKELQAEAELDLAKLMKRIKVAPTPALCDEYNAKNKALRAQGSKLTITNLLRVAIELGLQELSKNEPTDVLRVLNEVGVARGYWNGKAA